MINIRVCTARILKDRFQIEEEVTEVLFTEGILQDHVCRNFLIKEEYFNKVDISGRQVLKNHLADRFCVSTSTIEKVISNHP